MHVNNTLAERVGPDQKETNELARVVEVDPYSDLRWEAFLAGHPQGSVYQHPGWLRALELEYGRKTLNLACEDEAGEICAILPLLTTRGLPFSGRQLGARLSSLPRTPIAGPLARDTSALKLLLNAAVEYVHDRPGLRLQLKLASPEVAGMVEGLLLEPWRKSYVLSLPDSPEKLRFGDSRSHGRIKWEVRAAAKRGIVVRTAETESDLRDWYPLYLETMRWHAVPAHPYRFFRSLWELLRPGCLMRLLVAELHSPATRRIVAGSIFLSFGRTMFHAFNGVHRQDFSLRPNDVIHWHAIHQACKESFHFLDLGEVPGLQSGLAEFKSKWGAKPVPLYRGFYPALGNPHTGANGTSVSHTLAAKVWRFVPLQITAAVGDVINSFL
jgi:CelD/BcsL family acetyltransferase involved in cellulose biosynthesis